MFQKLGLITLGALLVRPDYRKKIEEAIAPVINNTIKPMIQDTIDNLNGKGNDTNVTNDISEQAEY